MEERLVRDRPGPAREVLQAGLPGDFDQMLPWMALAKKVVTVDKLQGGAPQVEVGL